MARVGVTLAGFVAVALAVGSGCAVAVADLVLVEDGVPKAALVLAAAPTKASQLAALEVQEHVRLITGVTLPIVDESTPVEGVSVFVGASRAARAPDDFAAEEYVVLFRPSAIVLAGDDAAGGGEVRYWLEGVPGAYDYLTWPGMFEAKGTLHAAYDFLERHCGVRWFNQSEVGTDVVQATTLRVEPRDVRRRPAFRYRDAGYSPVTMERYDSEASLWTVRWSESTPRFGQWLDLMYARGRRQPECDHPHRWLDYHRSRVFAFLTRRRLGGEPFKTNHSFGDWYDRFWRENPARRELFVGRRPEWFARGYPDEQLPPQLCYSNPEVVAQCLADARAHFALPAAARRAAPLGTDRFFPVVPMDNTSFCACERCLQSGPAERVHPAFSNGDHSVRVWSFVNAVAGGLAESHPDKLVSALAYSTYARRPPGMSIAPNVAVQLALFPQAVATDPAQVATDRALLQEWADGRPLYAWLYTGLTTGHKPPVPMFPQQMFGLYQGLVRSYREAGVQGVFFNGAPQETDAYFLFCLVDDPDQDAATLTADYFTRMYGCEAGGTMREFHETLAGIYTDPRHHAVGASGPDLDYGVLATAPRMKLLGELVARAERQLAGAPETWRRRFDLFRFGTWEAMLAGRAAYEAGKVVRATEPVPLFCPLVAHAAVPGEPDGIDWSDAQPFGGFNGWLRDDGDVSLRHIRSRFAHDGTRLHVRLHETRLAMPAAAGDAWEVVLRRPGGADVYRLRIGADDSLSGQVGSAGGVPQVWADHAATARSKSGPDAWLTTLVMPLASLPGGGHEVVLMNFRRVDVRGGDSPVLVATGNDFDSVKTGGLVSFDQSLPAAADHAAGADLVWAWDGSAAASGPATSAGHGHDVRMMGPVKMVSGGVELTGGGQYLELPVIEGLPSDSYTFNCWFRYPDADRLGHLLVLAQGAFEVRLGVPHRRLGFLYQPASGQSFGAGPSGVELEPGAWHMVTVVRGGDRISVYENGRLREVLTAERFQPADVGTLPWRVGGGPGRPPHYTLLGTIGAVQVFRGERTPQEILATYQKERRVRSEHR